MFKLQTVGRFWRQWQWEGKKQRGGNAADALVWLCRHVPVLPLDHDFKSKIAKRFHLIHLIHVIYIHLHINLKLTKLLSIKISYKSPAWRLYKFRFRSGVAESSPAAGRGCWRRRMIMSCNPMRRPLDPKNTFSFSPSFLPFLLLLFLEVGLCGKEEYHIFNKLWVISCRNECLKTRKSRLNQHDVWFSRLPLEAEYAHFSPALREEMLAETRRMFQALFEILSWGVNSSHSSTQN